MSSNTTLIPADRAGSAAGQPVGPGRERRLAVVAGQPGLQHVDDRQRERRGQRARSRGSSSPTGGVAGAGTGNFLVPPGGAANTASSFIFANMGGEIRGWRGGDHQQRRAARLREPGRRGLHGPRDRHGRRRAAALRGRSQAQPRRHGLDHVGAAARRVRRPEPPRRLRAVRHPGDRQPRSSSPTPASPRATRPTTARSPAPASAWSTRSTSTASSSRASRARAACSTRRGAPRWRTRTSAPTAATC